ncbi:poly-beta-hydroxybutyrate-responsive repressor [Oikeobacillus pervagus]|uniref:Poly-beta-hydroxybutyrate-responsive repressor n=1 Tax=Oikeobacillus pervagus TaxID=1325931 RepID=A0AAJ1SW77_9BACI|nr:poly-beta-hydroxybutyrate-responsive repressor [Oikeobacillus pervagus]MDQ0213983.1 poly-beta-hydroxybutyrate-responsive repressor [Oikeobacillus pervagus]
MVSNHKNPKEEKSAKKRVGGTPKNFMIPVLLLLLRDWNAHGYELMQKLIQFGFHSIDQGNFYRILRQLEKDELVTSEWDTSAGGPAKRIYSLTSAGEQYLQLWADSLGHYQKMLDQFFNMYSQFFTPPSFMTTNDDENN